MRTLLHPELRVLMEFGPDGFAAQWKHLKFMVSELTEVDGKVWLHASCSRTDKALPTYEDMADMKRLCIGDSRTALQVFPPKEKHVNYAGEHGIEVLHLWCCLDGDVTPDFTRGNGMI